MAEQNNLHCYKGEAFTPTFTMSPVEDITGWTVVGTVKRHSSDAVALLTISGSITDASGGVFIVSFTAANTTTLGPGTFAYDVWRTNAGSEAVLSIGILEVMPEVRV